MILHSCHCFKNESCVEHVQITHGLEQDVLCLMVKLDGTVVEEIGYRLVQEAPAIREGVWDPATVENDKEKRGVRISKKLFDGLSTVFCQSLHVQVLSRENATLLSI